MFTRSTIFITPNGHSYEPYCKVGEDKLLIDLGLKLVQVPLNQRLNDKLLLIIKY